MNMEEKLSIRRSLKGMNEEKLKRVHNGGMG